MKAKKGPELLKKWMEEKDFTQADAARHIGVSRQLFNKWLNGGSIHRTSAALLEVKTKIPRSEWMVRGQ